MGHKQTTKAIFPLGHGPLVTPNPVIASTEKVIWPIINSNMKPTCVRLRKSLNLLKSYNTFFIQNYKIMPWICRNNIMLFTRKITPKIHFMGG
jgi:hypothetical protein